MTVITRVKIPVIDANIDEVTVIKWLCREGDTVRKKQPLAEMTTEKAAFEFESPRAGVLRQILAPEKSVIPVGFVFALIGDAGDELPDVSEHNRSVLEEHRQGGGTVVARKPQPAGSGDSTAVRATPAARRLAREMGIDLAAVHAKFPDGIIDGATVKRFAEEKK